MIAEAADAPIRSRRVSRRELAVNRTVWLATGGMFAFYTLFAVLAALTTDVFETQNLAALATFAGATAIILLRSEPPAIGTRRNHVVVALAYVTSAAGMVASAPGGAFTLGGAFFIGPLAAVRLEDRRQIAAHLLAANVLIFGVAGFGGLSTAGIIMVALFNLASWVLCYSCVVTLEAAEAQGDELEQLVRRDPLTGVGNLRLLDERLADELARHERLGKELSIIALDLDGFTGLSGAVDHAAGEQVLRDVAAALLEAVDDRDTVTRQGGDEFCIVLPEHSPEIAHRSANAVRAALAGVRSPDGEPVRFCLSTASYPQDALTPDVLLHVADERLRLSKGADERGTADALRPGRDRGFGQA